jgi:hypothetical protein
MLHPHKIKRENRGAAGCGKIAAALNPSVDIVRSYCRPNHLESVRPDRVLMKVA